MIFTAGFLEMVLLWIMVMLQVLDARRTMKIVETGLSCKPKQLTSLTKRQVEITSTLFNEANGKHLGTWPPGFPALTVEQNSPILVDKVQCSLLFLAHGLDKILEDQRDNNPENVLLHKALKECISRVGLLSACLRGIQGGKCSSPPVPPEMPRNTFGRKQWSHTLLISATHYLHWLQHKLMPHKLRPHSLKKNWTINIKQKAIRPKYRAFIEGSGYLL